MGFLFPDAAPEPGKKKRPCASPFHPIFAPERDLCKPQNSPPDSSPAEKNVDHHSRFCKLMQIAVKQHKNLIYSMFCH
jgi:hypothetical protein